LLRKRVVDVSAMEKLLAGYLAKQLVNAIEQAGGQLPDS
jgi:hypothetical protein